MFSRMRDFSGETFPFQTRDKLVQVIAEILREFLIAAANFHTHFAGSFRNPNLYALRAGKM